MKGHEESTFGLYLGGKFLLACTRETFTFMLYVKLPIYPQSLDRVNLSSHKFNKTSSVSSPSILYLALYIHSETKHFLSN